MKNIENNKITQKGINLIITTYGRKTQNGKNVRRVISYIEELIEKRGIKNFEIFSTYDYNFGFKPRKNDKTYEQVGIFKQTKNLIKYIWICYKEEK